MSLLQTSCKVLDILTAFFTITNLVLVPYHNSDKFEDYFFVVKDPLRKMFLVGIVNTTLLPNALYYGTFNNLCFNKDKAWR